MLKWSKSALEAIVDNLDEHLIKNSGPGLLSGKTGTVMFLLYYARYANKDSKVEFATNLMLSALKSIEENLDYPTHCDGLSGYAWAVEHLVQQGFLDRENASFLDDLDPILYKWCLDLMNEGDFDFLYGSIGTAIYFISRSHKKQCRLYLAEFIVALEKKDKIETNGAMSWLSSNTTDGQMGCTLGLSHGISALIYFLSKASQLEELHVKSTHLLNKTIHYILDNKHDDKKGGAYFPKIILKNGDYVYGRNIGWCHGDMSVALTIYNAGKLTNNAKWKKIALEILLNSTMSAKQDSKHESNIGMCHGISGINYIYQKLYRETKIQEFEDASLIWSRRLQEVFQNQLEDTKNLGMSKFDLISGFSGVGLTLLSYLSNEDLEWDKCLMLS